MASDDIRSRDVAAGAIASSRRLLKAVPALPWQLDVRESPALDHDSSVLLRDAAGGAVAVIPRIEIAELVAGAVNERDALLSLEETVRAYREALACAAQARLEHREADRHQVGVNILDQAIGAAVRKLDRVRRAA